MAWQKWIYQGWARGNRDLWQKLSVAMASRHPDSVKFAKDKGHATNADVATGQVRAEDKRGNDGADKLACTGADSRKARG